MKRTIWLCGLVLSGCFLDALPQAVVIDAGAPGCGLPRPESDAALGCYNLVESPAEVASDSLDPYPPPPVPDGQFLPPPLSVPGPTVMLANGGVIDVEVEQYIPGQPIATVVAAADKCRSLAGCIDAVGIVEWIWVPVPELLELGFYPYSPTAVSTCRILPRPLCDGAAALHDAAVNRAMESAGYVQAVGADGVRGFIPDFAGDGPCPTTACQLRLGRALAAACRDANQWSFDRDRDGAGNSCDNCLDSPNPGQTNRDRDRLGDACDPCPDEASPLASQDSDGDGRPDCRDNCPERANAGQLNTDGDRWGDECDGDDDGDGLSDLDENLVGTNPLDADTDGDGARDGVDVCPIVADPEQRDTDSDGDGDVCDGDDDDDGLTDDEEERADTDPLDPDTDGDDHLDGADNCPIVPNPGQEETDDPTNGDGDACDLPLPPVEVHPDAPPASDQLVWIDAVRVEPPQTAPWALMHHPLRLVADAAESYFDGPVMINDSPDQPPAEPDPDQPPARRRSWHWVQQVAEQLIGEVEDATGRTIGIVLGRAYEQWAGNTYCHSNAHAVAFAEAGRDPERACRREVVQPRTTHDFDNPKLLIGTVRRRLRNGDVREYQIPRKRRHDCHCEGIDGVVAPLSEEYKASRSVRPMYRGRYHRWLVAQCKDYRFTLAKLTHEAFPHLGSLRSVYRRLFRSRRIGRPTLLYRLLRNSGAMGAVLDACRFAEFAEDGGIMPEAEVVRRRRAEPEDPWSQMQSRVSVPGWHSPPDAVRGCEGGVVQHYLARGCPVQPGVQAPPGLGRCEPGQRRWGTYTRCSPGFDVDEDPFVNPAWVDFETGAGSPRLPILDTPVCPPRWMSIQSALIWEEMADVDRLSSRIEAEGFEEFFDHFRSLHWWGFPIWIGAEQGGDVVQVVRRGQWVLTHEDVFMDFGLERLGRNGDPLSPVDQPPPIFDGVVGIPEEQVDPDEARDACFD